MLRWLILAVTCLTATAAAAQDRRPSHCIALSEAMRPVPVAWTDGIEADHMRITYIDHSTFFIQTPGGLSVATDYAGYLGPAQVVPDVVTMNNAHSTHWTARPDPAIPHALKGWPTNGIPADHFLDLGEMLVRNVTTDVRSEFGGVASPNGNSIFIFELAGLCVGHLGHLHHMPTNAQLARIGRLDVVMAPVDGTRTLDTPSMIALMERLRASVVLPMHWFGQSNLDRFLAGMEERFVVDRRDSSELILSVEDLPDRPTVIVLQPRPLRPTP